MRASSRSSTQAPGRPIISCTSVSSWSAARRPRKRSQGKPETMFLIDDILLAPVNGFKFILNQIQKMADRELNDDTVIKEQILELQMRLELEEISEEDYKEQEAELFARLRVIRA